MRINLCKIMLITLIVAASGNICMGESLVQWDIMYEADVLPTVASPPWIKMGNQTQIIEDGILHLIDTSDYNSIEYSRYDDPFDNSTGFTIEARVKYINGHGQGTLIYFWDKYLDHTKTDQLQIWANHIYLPHSNLTFDMDTGDDYHTYRITVKDDDIMVYVDGILRICGIDKYNYEIPSGTTIGIGFGDNGRTGSHENMWDYIRYTTSGVYPPPGYLPNDCSLLVDIDIKPGSDPNSINLSSAGVIPVAILSSDTFDAVTVDPESVSLAGARVKMVGKSGKYLCHSEDVNGDELLDMVCQVQTIEDFIVTGESAAVLEAETVDGIPIRGEDTVRIVPDN